MSRVDGCGCCEACKGSFPYYLIHCGFNDSAYAYCRRCGRTAILDVLVAPKGVEVRLGEPVPSAVESRLLPCECGDRFSGTSCPRCPHCSHELSASLATEWIEANAAGTKSGWRWQRSWSGLYAIVVSDRVVKDNWLPTHPMA